MTLSQLFFFYNATIIIVTALLAVTRKNPVHSVLLMLIMFFHVAGMYLFLNAEFIAALQVIVYAGAILVLFLFVILLVNRGDESLKDKNIASWPSSAVLSLSLFAIIAMAVNGIKLGPSKHYTIDFIQKNSNIDAVGTLLYTDYIFPFEVASLILLVAIVGAITLTKRTRRGD